MRHADFLLADMLSGIEDSPADVVIGNPPYIRYDDLADDLAALYRSTWPTMRGRGDIYVGFIERSLADAQASGARSASSAPTAGCGTSTAAAPRTGRQPVRRRARLDDA